MGIMSIAISFETSLKNKGILTRPDYISFVLHSYAGFVGLTLIKYGNANDIAFPICCTTSRSAENKICSICT